MTAEANITGEIGTAWRVNLALAREPPPRITEARSLTEPGGDRWIRLAVASSLMTVAVLVVPGLHLFVRLQGYAVAGIRRKNAATVAVTRSGGEARSSPG